MAETQKAAKGRSYRGVDSELRRQTRRRALIEAGLELFGTRGYRSTSVKTVCDKAGLTERYFYESFPNREGLLGALFDTLVAELDTRMRGIAADGEDAGERLRRVIEEFFGFMYDDERRLRVMLFEVLGVGPDIDRRYQAAVRELARIMENPAMGLFPESSGADDGRRVVSVGLVGAITQIATQWALEDFRTPVDQVEAKALEIMWAVADYQHGSHVSASDRLAGRAP